MDYLAKIDRLEGSGALPKKEAKLLRIFFESYLRALKDAGRSYEEMETLIDTHIDLVTNQSQSPFEFPPFSPAQRAPFDYHRFALDSMEPALDRKASTLQGGEHLAKLVRQVRSGDNVVLFSNHQTEPDPQLLCLMLQEEYPDMVDKLIFVAGHRVTSDPLSIPYSMGHDLICIYSKRYIDTPPEGKGAKLDHNRRAMRRMGDLLSEGGKFIWVAPSGGRDRPDENNTVQIAPFNAQAVEMFFLMARQAKTPTHFNTLAMWTYDFLPPPASVEIELGELRLPAFTPIHLCFGPEVRSEELEFTEVDNKKIRRQRRAEALWEKVRNDYARITSYAGHPRAPHRRT